METEKYMENIGWERMKALLDKQGPKPVPVLYKVLPYAAILVFGLLGGYIFFQGSFTESSPVTQTAVVESNDNIDKAVKDTGGDKENIQKEQIAPEEVVPQKVTQPTPVLTAALQPSINVQTNNTAGNTLVRKPNETTVNTYKGEAVEAVQKDNNEAPVVVIEDLKEEDVKAEGPKRPSMINELEIKRKRQAEKNNEKGIHGLDNSTKKRSAERGVTIPLATTLTAIKNTGNARPVQVLGALGILTSGFDGYGMRSGLELKKPLDDKLSIVTGVRYSRVKEQYDETYQIDPMRDSRIANSEPLANLARRKVDRNFVEIPLYLNLEAGKQIDFKAGLAVTYNMNDSDNLEEINSQLAQNSVSSFDRYIGNELQTDHDGYLGEGIFGAKVNFDKVSVELEAIKGIIKNENVENRSILGLRLSYNFAKDGNK